MATFLIGAAPSFSLSSSQTGLFSRSLLRQERALARQHRRRGRRGVEERETKMRARELREDALFSFFDRSPSSFFFVREGGQGSATGRRTTQLEKSNWNRFALLFLSLSSPLFLAAGPLLGMENPAGDANAPGEGEHASVSGKRGKRKRSNVGRRARERREEAIDRDFSLFLCCVSPTPFFLLFVFSSTLAFPAQSLSSERPTDGIEDRT